MSPEKENTIRALQDKPLIMTSFLCKFGIHKWTKYSPPCERGQQYFPSKRPGGYYTVMIQETTCAHCNIIKYRSSYKYTRG